MINILGIICQTNKYAQELCNDNYFWVLKLNKLFPRISYSSKI